MRTGPGRDLTLLVHASARTRCGAAVRALSALGVEVDWIEWAGSAGLTALAGPLSTAASEARLLSSLQRTGRLACISAGGAAAVASGVLLARVGERLGGGLRRPVLRIVLPPEGLPSEHLVQALLQLVAGPRASRASGAAGAALVENPRARAS